MELLTALAALVCVATAFGLSLAHALELPGKLRLDRDDYRTVQAIYYPGFTIGGMVGELGGLVLLSLLLFITAGSQAFAWVAVSLALLACVHGAYWLLTHPVNSFWVEEVDKGQAATAFFETGRGAGAKGDWSDLRRRWERSHVIRAVLALLSLLSLTIAIGV